MADKQEQKQQPEAAKTQATRNPRNARGRGGRDDRRKRRPGFEKTDQYEEAVISIDRVSRVVKGGRRFRFKALVAVGDKKNLVGIGVAKGADVQTAIAKAGNVARKKMIKIAITNETIPHEIETKKAGARVLLKPAAPGTGVIAGGVVRAIIDLTGIKNLLSKSLGSSNKVNIAYATIEALSQVLPQEEWLANKNKPKTAAKKSIAKEKKNEV